MGAPTERKQLEVLTALDQAKTQYYHFTAIVIAGMGFFTDAYDLFSIGIVTKLLGRIYYATNTSATSPGPGVMPIRVQAAVTGTALCGTLAGQILFGWLGDKLGRKKVYGITLAIMVVFSIGSGLSFGSSRKAVIGTLCFMRFWLGVGIGGDYPLSATIMSEYANTKTRGAFIAAVFAMQGFGILTAGAFGVIVALAFNKAYPSPAWSATDPLLSVVPQADYVWRIIFMFGAIPAAMTLYYRMKMPETARYTALVEGNAKKAAQDMNKVLNVTEATFTETSDITIPDMSKQYGLFSMEFVQKHGLHLLGTTSTWFILDVAFYSQTLFQTQIFSKIGWTPKAKTMNAIYEIYKGARAQCIISLCSTVPGYWVTVALIDRIGRFIIQLQGFIFMAIFMFALAIPFDTLTDGSKGHIHMFLVLYSLTFFFANFGPNATTFIVPAEIFPARLRATCHGLSAASGKAGAIIGAFGFLYASQDTNPIVSDPYKPGIGLRKSLLILASLNAIGAMFSFFVPETSNMSLEDLSGDNELGAEIGDKKDVACMDAKSVDP